MELKELCRIAHEIAVANGFYDAYDGNRRPIPQLLMLVTSELGECLESDRNDDFNGVKEELADAFIRLGDMVEYLEIDIEKEIQKKMEKNKKRPWKHNKRY